MLLKWVILQELLMVKIDPLEIVANIRDEDYFGELNFVKINQL